MELFDDLGQLLPLLEKAAAMEPKKVTEFQILENLRVKWFREYLKCWVWFGDETWV